jgi:GTP-binding protein
MSIDKLRNIAIIAHVDHGKTTLVDKLLQQTGTLDRKNMATERIMDSDDQEKERGITILAKNTSINWKNHRINIVDTPGHADFGGEVERVLSMVDSVLLLVDAVEGPMPQTRFVTQKAFDQGLNPILVINKIDRHGARPDWVLDKVFDLFDRLGGSDEQLDFPVIYSSALNGVAGLEENKLAEDMTPLLQLILDKVNPPSVDVEGSLQMQISALDYSNYVGVIGIGRITRGKLNPNDQVIVAGADGKNRKARVLQIMGYNGLDRIEIESAQAGDIVCITGIDKLNISDTICDPDNIDLLPPLSVDEPTVSMTFQVNDSPFAGREGKYISSRNLKERLETELLHNVALKVEQGESPDKFIVSGRGELHLSVLIENMRRENYELGVSKPEVIQKEINGIIHEPFEEIVIDIEGRHQGPVMEEMGIRKADLKNMEPDGKGRNKLQFIAPSRGMIGFRSYFLTLTSGTGIMTSVFDHYGPAKPGDVAKRQNGVLVSMAAGKTLAYSLFNLQERGKMFLGKGQDVYIGQIVGLHSRSNDLPVNPTKAKQLTNVRASGTDDALFLTPHKEHTLEQALEFVEDDELVEVTPKSIRLRKRI